MLCDFSALCILQAGQDVPKLSELIHSWTLPRSPEETQERRGGPGLWPPAPAGKVSGKISSSISILHSQTENPMDWSTFLQASWRRWKKRVKRLVYNSTLKKLRLWHPVPSLHGNQMGKKWKQWQILFSWAPKSLWIVTVTMILKDTCSLEEKLWQT